MSVKAQYLALAAFTGAYFLATAYRASHKPFWFDELFTFYISRLPDWKQMWAAATHGVDFNPPIVYWLTRLAQSGLGVGEQATRLPETIGFWIFCLCLYRFVAARSNPLGGFVALITPVVTYAYFFAYEARAHGLALGFGGIALVSWQLLAEGRRFRRAAALALFLSLSCALLTHSYAFVWFAPLAAGEAVRGYTNRKVDILPWCALAAASLCILASIPLLHSAHSTLSAGYLPASPGRVMTAYLSIFAPGGAAFALAAAALAIDRAGGTAQGASQPIQGFRPYEWTAVAAFLAIPFVVFLAASVAHAPMVTRYALCAVVGVACPLGIAAAERPLAGVAILAVLLAQSGVDFAHFRHSAKMPLEPGNAREISVSREVFDGRYRLMSSPLGGGLPIFLTDDLDFGPTIHYAPPGIRDRLVYIAEGPVDFPVDFPEDFRGWDRLRACCGAPGKTASMGDMLRRHSSFLIYCPSGRCYAAESVNRAAAVARLIGTYAGDDLYLISYSAEAPAATVPAGGQSTR